MRKTEPRRSRPWLRNAASLALLGGLVWVGCLLLAQPPSAPNFRLTSLDGRQLSAATLRGKLVLVSFWATTCQRCLEEMPQLVATEERFAGQGFATVAVAMQYDNPAWVAAYAKANALPFYLGQDHDGSVAQAFGDVRATPTSFLLDRHGRIVQRFVGAPPWAALQARIATLLAEPPSNTALKAP